MPTNVSAPDAPVSGGASGRRRIVLEATDGNRFAAFSAATGIVDAPGVVILPDVRGHHPFCEELELPCRMPTLIIFATSFEGNASRRGDPHG